MSRAEQQDQYQTRELTGNAPLLDEVLKQQPAMSEQLIQMRMEHESIMAECRARPRRMADMLKEIEEQLRLVPEFAKAAIYAKPIGTVFRVECQCGNRYEVAAQWNNMKKTHVARQEDCPRCEKWAPKSVTKQQKKARNLSIRAAEAIAEVYGYNRVHSGLVMLDDTHVKVTASFFDYQKLRSWITETIVSKIFVDKYKKVTSIPDDRFFDVTVKAAGSKAIREAIVRCTPPALRLRMFALAEEISSETLNDGEIQKIVDAFGQRAVTLRMLERHIGRTMREGWTKADRLELLEAWNAIRDEEATINEVFGDDDDKTDTAPDGSGTTPPNGAVTGADLGAAKGQAVSHPHPKTEQPQESTQQPEPPTGAALQQKAEAAIRAAKTEDDIRAVYAQYGKHVPDQEALYAAAEARTMDLQSVQQERQAVGQERLTGIREKINAYKQPGRIQQLVVDADADPSFSPAERAQVKAWAESRLKGLSGQLPLET